MNKKILSILSFIFFFIIANSANAGVWWKESEMNILNQSFTSAKYAPVSEDKCTTSKPGAGYVCYDLFDNGTFTSPSTNLNFVNPTDNLQIKLPESFFKFTKESACPPDPKDPDAEKKMCIPWIGEYVAGMYNFGISIIGIIAVVILMFAGMIRITSGGNSSRVTESNAWIFASISGLVIALTSYVIMKQVNPQLVNVGSNSYIKITMVEKLPEIKYGSESEQNLSTTGSVSTNLQSIKGIDGIIIAGSVSDPNLPPETIEFLKKAAAIAVQNGVKLQVTSAHRSIETQQQLWDAAVQKYGSEEEAKKYVAKPSLNAPHVKGVAVDICIAGSASCQQVGRNATLDNADTQNLDKIMHDAGWKRYCGEWWHYQPSTNPPTKAC
ncbi:MAG: D-alanyl-D-alanine carboxypeptidase family protein [Candidatus Falkowbacteria bacterium]